MTLILCNDLLKHKCLLVYYEFLSHSYLVVHEIITCLFIVCIFLSSAGISEKNDCL
jgi:hypothetical protein